MAISGKTTLKQGASVFHRHFTSDPAVVASVVAALGAHLKQAALSKQTLSSIEIVLGEAINNINEHAYGGLRDRPIEMRAVLMDDDVVFSLVDSGVAMPRGELPPCIRVDTTGPAAQLPEGGFGWCLIRDLAHDLQYVRKGGENRFSFRVTIGGAGDII